MNKNYFFIKISIIMILICLYPRFIIISIINNFISYIKIKIEIKRIKTLNKFCSDNIKIIKKFRKMKNPKVSLISPIYNREGFLTRFLKNIQHQNFDDIEIIFVDDKSTDAGVKILKKYQKLDKRIKIIKHKKNKGTFISRNIGVLYSNAKYIILPDPDDIISKDIIRTCLYYAEKYNYEIKLHY